MNPAGELPAGGLPAGALPAGALPAGELPAGAPRDPAPPDPPRVRVALGASRVAGRLSRSLGLGSGSVVGGRVALAVAPGLVGHLTRGRRVAVVTGTNGKTTTTRLLAAALGGSGPRSGDSVAWSAAGANMPAGIVAALAEAARSVPAVLEVDEAYLPQVIRDADPAVVVLLNLSRDQLDRTSEVRRLALAWNETLSGFAGVVVANADDPLVVFAASSAPRTLFVGAGQRWRDDAHHCPRCDASIEFAAAGWRCPSCGLGRPATVAELVPEGLAFGGGAPAPLSLRVPGSFNRANAALALVAAEELGAEREAALAAIASVSEVAGRFSLVHHGSFTARLMLAKNPAGWSELIDLLASGDGPLLVSINARLADGQDPSWLWDAPFERLRSRPVVATGDRCLDLAVRLEHAGVAVEVVEEPLAALRRAAMLAGSLDTTPHAGTTGLDHHVVDAAGNYTAFQELRRLTAAGPATSRASASTERGARTMGGPRARARQVVAASLAPAEPARRGGPTGPRSSAVRIVVVHPDLLGTYGDGGNGQVLADRALWRGMDAELVLATSDRHLPESGDCYVLGGGEDGPQFRSVELLRAGPLARLADSGVTVLAVCAGFQIAGSSFPGPSGSPVAGLGLLDARTWRTPRPRAVGEVVVRPAAPLEALGVARTLTGFENHASLTTLGTGVAPLGEVLRGTGNDGAGGEGALAGSVVGTYLHGPVLARNPSLADAVLRLATGAQLAQLDDAAEEALRSERAQAALTHRSPLRKLVQRKN